MQRYMASCDPAKDNCRIYPKLITDPITKVISTSPLLQEYMCCGILIETDEAVLLKHKGKLMTDTVAEKDLQKLPRASHSMCYNATFHHKMWQSEPDCALKSPNEYCAILDFKKQ